MRVGDAVLFYSMHPNATFDKARGALRGAAASGCELTRRRASSTRCTAAAPW